MKTERRHELKENELAQRLEIAVEWCRSNATLLLVVAVAIAASGAAYAYFAKRSAERSQRAWDTFYSGESTGDTTKLEQLAKGEPDTVAGQLAALYLADVAFTDGVQQMSTDREAAEARLAAAKDWYSAVRQNVGDAHLQQRALLGLARYFETIGDLDQAKEHYASLATISGGLYEGEAREKLKELERPSTREFAEWYKKQRPRPLPSGTAGMTSAADLSLPPFPSGASATGAGGSAPAATASATSTPSPTPSAAASPSSAATPTASASGSKPTGTAK